MASARPPEPCSPAWSRAFRGWDWNRARFAHPEGQRSSGTSMAVGGDPGSDRPYLPMRQTGRATHTAVATAR